MSGLTAPGPVADRLEESIRIARAAGELVLSRFLSPSLGVSTKADGTPVSEADRAAEALIRERIGSAFPDDGVLGEEFGETRGGTGFRWIIDPIDGTYSFIHGVPLFTTLIAIEDTSGGGVVAGVIHAPALDEMVYARLGGGAWHAVGDRAPVPARVSDVAPLSGATIATTSLDYWDDSNTPIWLRIHDRAAHTRGWPDAYAALLVATGRCEGLVEPSLHCWDIAPFGPILSEAGGRATDWRGVETAHTSAVVASNGAIHDELLEVLTRVQ